MNKMVKTPYSLRGLKNKTVFKGISFAKRGVILVTANYRLGLFGYFAHPELDQRDGNSGNYGLYYMFETLDRCWRPLTDGDYKLSAQMLEDWTEFIKKGSPCYADYPYIKKYNIKETN